MKIQSKEEIYYVIFDTETTGLDYSKDEIIEIAGQKVKDGIMIETFHELLIPTVELKADTSAIHNISMQELQSKGKRHGEVIPKFMEFIGDLPLLGHNIMLFDVPFLNSHLLRLQLPLVQNKIIDTLTIARQSLKLPSYSLENLSAFYGISYEGAHRALKDVEINREVYNRLVRESQKTLF